MISSFFYSQALNGSVQVKLNCHRCLPTTSLCTADDTTPVYVYVEKLSIHRTIAPPDSCLFSNCPDPSEK